MGKKGGNAVTPMTFLFMQSQVKETVRKIDFTGSGKLLTTIGGQGVTLVNPSFFEAERTCKCLKSSFLLTLPGLDSFL